MISYLLRLSVALGSAFSLLFSPIVALAEGPFSGPTSGALAVTPPGYDNIRDVLQALNFSSDEIPEANLTQLSNIEKYDVLYINCSGSIDGVAKDAAAAVREYVSKGGIVYASDYAASLVNQAFPGKINFYKGSLETAEGIDASIGARVGAPGKVTAKVTDPGLANVLGKTSVEVNYDLGAWVVIESAGAGTRVHMRGPSPVVDLGTATEDLGNIDYNNPQSLEELNKKLSTPSKTLEDTPYVVSFTEGKGEVLYTTFHNEAQVTDDVKQVLNWFGVRAKGGKLARATQDLATQGGNEVLQEVVDGINKGEKKQYTFNATGDGNFSIILNFGGSALDLSVKDPKGKEVASQKVDKPPYTAEVQAVKGKYTMAVEGVDVPEQNMPFVLAVSGPKSAAAEPIVDQGKKDGATVDINISGWSLLAVLGIGALIFVIIIIVIVVIAVRRKGKSAPPKE